ncbi:P-type ATPase protein [Necator americanus]|uniref:P-type ATPase protein n=1 Tax=Necator americanus TaxID=51031 RepID=W2SK31_NECAM|nr:P-type ATPase protein [Necator americanus]ETN69903.1 P-type ATPase protein [Necator americanus]
MYGFEEYYELGLIGAAIIGLVQALIILFCHWFVSVKCYLSCVYEEDPYKATLAKRANSTKVWFEFQKVHYTLDETTNTFGTVIFDSHRPMKYYQQSRGVESDDQLEEIKYLLGDNKTEMVIPQFWDLFKERATAPFFVFQVFCVGLWCLEDMWYYSLFTLFMLMTFEATLVKAQLKNMQEIRNMGNKAYMIQAYRNHKWIKIKTDELVSGDIVSVGRSADERAVPCDMILLRGPCIVDESMLTGESVPQMKEPIEDLEKDRYFDIDADSRLHVIFGGTKIVQHTPPGKGVEGLKSPDNGCICYVLRTGFNTSQGKLLRTIMFGVKRVTANNLETFCFILFLLIFAVAAAAYLWVVGSQDEKRNKYKLFLECTLILTSVIPPELPIELSLAVNTSLIALQKLGVFCTEPFRIPFAGKIDICCFDKTGTLTTDNLVVEGIAFRSLLNFTDEEKGLVKAVSDVPAESVQVLACCHSLVRFDDDLVGDPLEKACLTWCDWSLTKGDAVLPPKGSKQTGLKIFLRYHFSSAMKRMTVVAGYQVPGFQEPKMIVAVKGAPETLRSMYEHVPHDYDEIFTNLTRQGARVLAMGIKELNQTRIGELRDTKRETLENNLRFAGFVVISCPLKPDTKVMIKEIIESSHKVVMVTGDNPLTACNVAKVLKFIRKKVPTLVLDEPFEKTGEWKWKAVDESVEYDVVPFNKRQELKKFFLDHEFCLTGPAFSHLLENNHSFLRELIMHVRVFARMAPKQKERVINEYKSLGCVTLMCGDGTNDVGALKHSNVGGSIKISGVALLSHPYDPTRAEQKEKEKKEKIEEARRLVHTTNPTPPGIQAPLSTHPSVVNAHNKLEKLMKELEEEERASITRLGDASIAAPFTSKYTSIASICHVIKQGRCTLVTTLQMFKILALNALVSAYSLSALYMDGVKFSDTQATIQGLLLAACFLFVSRSKPLKTLSKQRPMSNIFNAYTLLTVTGQFVVHFGCLLYVVKSAHAAAPRTEPIDLEAKFSPNILNTSVYIISMALQVCTFAVNYRGRPFMESLLENKAMLYSILISGSSVFMLAVGASDEAMQQFELVVLPPELRNILVYCVSFDLVACYMIDRILNFLLGDMF